MKKCANCGKENIDEAIYCADCGSELNSDFSSSGKSVNTDFEEGNVFSSGKSVNTPYEKRKRKLKYWCCYVPLVLFIVFMASGLIYYGFAESFPVFYGSDYDYLDLDGDGRLSFDEASQIDTTVSDTEMKESFGIGDTNNNGYLKGHEFELFYDDVKFHFANYTSQSDNDKYKYSSSGGSSSHGRDYNSGNSKYADSLNNQEFDRSEGYVLTCPYCGSESIYETGNGYRCAECGRSIYSADDLELGYWEGYMELLTPVFVSY